jgi:hypothetical protein
MFDRISRSWQLVKASGNVLMQDKELLLFPLLSSVAAFVVLLCFALPMFGVAALDGVTQGRVGGVGMYVLGFLFYLTQYFVIFFFNAALVGAAMKRLDGGNPTLSDGLSIAFSKWQSILGYAAIAATVGLILRALQERAGFIGRIVLGLIGMAWTVATYLVVPVLVARDVGPLEAVKESASLLKETWGENVVGQVGISAAFAVIHFVLIIFSAVFVIAAVLTKSVALIVLVLTFVVAVFVLTALVQAALSGIYAAALYRYADGKQSTDGFDATALENAFAPTR